MNENERQALGLWHNPEVPSVRLPLFRNVDSSFGVRRAAATERRDICQVNITSAALLLLLHTLPNTERRCPDCERRGGGWEQISVHNVSKHFWGGADAALSYVLGIIKRAGHRAHIVGEDDDGWTVHGEMSCPTCSVAPTPMASPEPTGWVPQRWSEVMLDAMPRRSGRGEQADYWRPSDGGRAVPINIDNPAARDRLAVLADELQQRGEPLGEWLALWLAEATQELDVHTQAIAATLIVA